MKNSIIICLVLFFSIINAQKKEEYFDKKFISINARFQNIEDKGTFYIYHIKNDTMDGVFTSTKECNKSNLWKNIKLKKKYKLILVKPDVHATSKTDYRVNEHVGDVIVWNSDMKSIFFPGCNNVCGKKIFDVK